MRLAVFLGLLIALVPTRLWAQNGLPPDRQAAYREQISQALQEYSLGHWAEARVFFADAHALWPNARTFRGLGMATYEGREYAEAIEFLEQALQSNVQPLTPKLASESRTVLEQARRFVATLRLELDPASASVLIDDRQRTLRPDGTVVVNPGQHQVDIAAAGYEDLHRTFVAEAGQSARLRLKLKPLLDTEAATPEAPRTVEQPVMQARMSSEPAVAPRLVLAKQQPVAAAVLSGVGVAAVGVGWMFFAMRDSLRLDFWEAGVLGSNSGAVTYDRAALQRYRLDGGLAIASSAVGSLLLAYAQYDWLPEPAEGTRVPVWAWVAGAGGLALGLGALGLALFASHCEVADPHRICQQVTTDAALAPLLAVHALPFLSLPLMYLARPRTREARQVAWAVSPSGGMSGMSGMSGMGGTGVGVQLNGLF